MKELKKCNRCKEKKLLSEFHKNISSPDGKRNMCIKCANERNEYYRKLAKQKQWDFCF